MILDAKKQLLKMLVTSSIYSFYRINFLCNFNVFSCAQINSFIISVVYELYTHSIVNECMNNLFDLFWCFVFWFRFIGFNSNMRRCARSVITQLIITIIKNMDSFEASHRNLVFSIVKLVNRYFSPIHSSRNNGIW